MKKFIDISAKKSIIYSVIDMNVFKFNDFCLPLGKKTYIMGILNITPDSFFDGGLYFDTKKALCHAEEMISAGVDIIDIGAVSTRPFATEVDEKEEWQRLEPVLKEIKRNFSVPVSVDTFNAATVEKCIDLGADIINDVSGVFCEQTAEKIKNSRVGWIIMHSGVKTKKAEEISVFENGIVENVNSFFSSMLEKIEAYGIEKERICLDAGFGFAKDFEQNIELLKNFDKLDTRSCALLCALSNKRFTKVLAGEENALSGLNPTIACNIAAVIKGADIVRVHNVEEHKKCMSVIDMLFK